MPAVITGIGVYYPERIVSNSDLAKIVDTSDEWISERTGIRERRIIAEGSTENASDLGVKALRQALDKAGLKAEQLDGIITAAINPDMQFPATACFIQQKIGARGFAFDITAACAGFVYGVNMASLLIDAGQCRHVAVVGAELLSRIIDWKDRNTCILFGDAAGAVILSATSDGERGVLNSVLESDGNFSGILQLNNPVNAPEGGRFLEMDGKAVFKLAVKSLKQVVEKSLDRSFFSVEDLDLAVFHQANRRILDAVAKGLGLPPEKIIVNVHKFGNTSSASIPLALADAEAEGLLVPGKLVTLAAIGGGMSWGCNLIRW